MHRILKTCAWLLCATSALGCAERLSAQQRSDGAPTWITLVERDSIGGADAKERRDTIRVDRLFTGSARGTQPRYVQIRLEVHAPEVADLDLQVEAHVEGRDSVLSLCSSSETGRIDDCFFPAARVPPGATVVTKVFAYEGGGSAFRLRARGVAGPLIRNLFVGDATRLDTIPMVFTVPHDQNLLPENAARQLLFILPPGRVERELTLSGRLVEKGLGLRLFKQDGAPIDRPSPPHEAGPFRLRLQPGDSASYALVDVVHREYYTSPDSLVGTEYRISAKPVNRAVAIVLGRDGFATTLADTISRAEYEFTLPRDSIGMVLLRGRGRRIRIDPSARLDVDTVLLADIGAMVGIIGRRTGDGLLLQGSNHDSVEVRIVAERDPSVRHSARRHELLIRTAGTPRHTLVAPAVLRQAAAARVWPTGARTESLIPNGGVTVWRLAPEGGAGQPRRSPLPSHSVRLVEGADLYDLVVTNDHGEVLDIGDRAVGWNWPDSGASVFLAIIPQSAGGQGANVVLSYTRP